MTIISAHQYGNTPLSMDSLKPLYEGTDTNAALGQTSKIGLEVEYTLFDKATHKPLSTAQNTALVEAGRAQNIAVNQEPSAALLELTSKPYTKHNITTLLKELCYDAHGLHNIATHHNIGISPFGQLPAANLNDHQVINLERYQTFFAQPREDMIETFRFFASCLNIQTSISYRNAEHLLKIIRMITALEPIIILSTDSSSGFDNSQPIQHVHNLAHKDKVGINGGIPDFYYTAQTGQDLINAHIDFTLTNPHVFAYFNYDGKLTRLPTGKWTSFNQLEAQNLGPQSLSNYLQAQSESWRRACNIATILDDHGNLIGHRAELAAFQTGLMHQRGTAAALTSLIAYDEPFYDQTQALLLSFGIDITALADCKPLLQSNFKNACYHNNQYHTVPFGNGTVKDFTRAFADIIESAADRAKLTAHTKPIIHIMRQGRPDWLVYREAFPTLEDTLAYMHNFDTHTQNNPDLLSPWSCADMVFEKMGMNKSAP